MRTVGCVLGLLLMAAAGMGGESAEAGWKCGVAKARITLDKLFWMGGFAVRTHPAEGKLDELLVKALALEAPDGGVALLVTADLVGIPKWLYDGLSAEIERRHHLDRSRIRICTSHTHSGPVLTDALSDVYPLDDQQRLLIGEYSHWLEATILDTVDKAIASRQPVTLWAGQGKAAFAYNRRTNVESTWDEMAKRGESPKGPSDFAVPVLAVRSGRQLVAVVFGYAAHASALTDNYLWSADYPGVTQRFLENTHPGATAMFFQGCGSDQSAMPRGTVERCRALGQALTVSVEAVLSKPMRPVAPVLRTGFEFVPLDFGAQPSQAELEKTGQGTDYRARWARRLSAELAAGKSFARGYPEYPVQVWRLGADQRSGLRLGERRAWTTRCGSSASSGRTPGWRLIRTT